MSKRILSVLLVSLLAACASQGAKEQGGAAVEERAVQPAKPAEKPAEAKPLPTQPIAVNPLKDPNNILSKRSVYYDFDSYAVKDEYKPMVQAHAKYLHDHNSAHATLQGNADERGSREYNLALGQRRADSVKQAMEVLGVPDKQIETVSFGKEKPRAPGHDEASWTENRRSDIVYQGE